MKGSLAIDPVCKFLVFPFVWHIAVAVLVSESFQLLEPLRVIRINNYVYLNASVTAGTVLSMELFFDSFPVHSHPYNTRQTLIINHVYQSVMNGSFVVLYLSLQGP